MGHTCPASDGETVEVKMEDEPAPEEAEWIEE